MEKLPLKELRVLEAFRPENSNVPGKIHVQFGFVYQNICMCRYQIHIIIAFLMSLFQNALMQCFSLVLLCRKVYCELHKMILSLLAGGSLQCSYRQLFPPCSAAVRERAVQGLVWLMSALWNFGRWLHFLPCLTYSKTDFLLLFASLCLASFLAVLFKYLNKVFASLFTWLGARRGLF